MAIRDARAAPVLARWFGPQPIHLAQTEKQTSWGTGVAEQNRGLAIHIGAVDNPRGAAAYPVVREVPALLDTKLTTPAKRTVSRSFEPALDGGSEAEDAPSTLRSASTMAPTSLTQPIDASPRWETAHVPHRLCSANNDSPDGNRNLNCLRYTAIRALSCLVTAPCPVLAVCGPGVRIPLAPLI